MTPWYVNLFENALTVQFDHRLLAYAIAAWVAIQAVAGLRAAPAPWRTSAFVLVAGVVLQITLGIWTLLTQVPIALGLAHQAGGFALLALAVWHARRVQG